MKSRIFLTVFACIGTAFAGPQPQPSKAKNEPAATLELYTLLDKEPDKGRKVTAPDKSDLGWIGAKPELTLGPILEVVLMAPKSIRNGKDGKPGFVELEAETDLIVNLQPEDEKRLQPLFEKGDQKLALRIKSGAGEKFYAVEFAPITPSLFVLTSVEEMKKLEPELKKCVGPQPAAPGIPEKQD